MEFWIFILFIGVFSLWVQSRIRRRNEDQRFSNLIEALNCLEPRLNELKKLQTRVQELEQRLATSAPPPIASPSAQQPAASEPSPPATPASAPPKPVEPTPAAAIPPPPQIPKPVLPVRGSLPAPHPPTPQPQP